MYLYSLIMIFYEGGIKLYVAAEHQSTFSPLLKLVYTAKHGKWSSRKDQCDERSKVKL